MMLTLAQAATEATALKTVGVVSLVLLVVFALAFLFVAFGAKNVLKAPLRLFKKEPSEGGRTGQGSS